MVLCGLTRCLERDKGTTQQETAQDPGLGLQKLSLSREILCPTLNPQCQLSDPAISVCLNHDGPAEPAAEAKSGRSLHSVKPVPGRQDRQQGVQR